MSGNVAIKTETTGTGASIVKLGLVDDATLCSVPIKEEFEASARADIGGVVSEQPIALTGVFAATSRFSCSGNILTIVTPVAGFGEVTAQFQRIR